MFVEKITDSIIFFDFQKVVANMLGIYKLLTHELTH